MKRLALFALLLIVATGLFAQNTPVVTIPSNTGSTGAASGTAGAKTVIQCDALTTACSTPNFTLIPGSGNVAVLTADFTDSSSTGQQTITGLAFTLPANTPANYPFRCEFMYSQATAAVADGFGIQAATFNPTRIDAQGWAGTSAAVVALGNIANLTTTTATSIVAFTPSAITTVWNARITGVIQNPANSSAQTLNFTVSQTTAGDLVTVKAGSWCAVGF